MYVKFTFNVSYERENSNLWAESSDWGPPAGGVISSATPRFTPLMRVLNVLKCMLISSQVM